MHMCHSLHNLCDPVLAAVLAVVPSTLHMLVQVLGETEVKAQIKLLFRSNIGAPIRVIRSFQVGRGRAFCPHALPPCRCTTRTD
jgi:hypothetical protein